MVFFRNIKRTSQYVILIVYFIAPIVIFSATVNNMKYIFFLAYSVLFLVGKTQICLN